MRIIISAILVFLPFQMVHAEEIDKSRVPSIELYQAMFDANVEPGLVQFRDFNGKQYLYFSALQTLHCRLKEIRYSINSDALDQRFDLVKCNPQTPFNMPPDFELSDIALTLKLGTADNVSVQVVWEDDRESEVSVYEPCKDVGDQTCAWPIK